MPISFDITSFGAFLAFVGPLLVGAITGLKTSSKVKAIIAIALMAAIAVAQAYTQGGLSSDIFGSFLVIIAIWQTSYAGIWKSLGLTKLLQDSIPVKIGAPSDAVIPDVLPMIDEGAPVQTDNSTRVDDGPQDVAQDPSVDLTEGEEIPEVWHDGNF